MVLPFLSSFPIVMVTSLSLVRSHVCRCNSDEGSRDSASVPGLDFWFYSVIWLRFLIFHTSPKCTYLMGLSWEIRSYHLKSMAASLGISLGDYRVGSLRPRIINWTLRSLGHESRKWWPEDLLIGEILGAPGAIFLPELVIFQNPSLIEDFKK